MKIDGNMCPVHHLVKRTFDGPPPDTEATEVHHKDGSSENNRLDNLAYVTRSQNMRYFFATSATRVHGRASVKPVMWRSVGSEDWETSPSITTAAKQLGMSSAALSKACQLNLVLNGYEHAFASLEQQSLPGEEWRQLIDPKLSKAVDGMLVSSLGRVKFQTGRISEGHRQKQGYCRVLYRPASGLRAEYVHRLVARAFLGPAPTLERMQINHKDGIKSNNAILNLEYVTPGENRSHFLASAEENGWKKASIKPVWSRLVGSKEWQWHNSMQSAALTLGLRTNGISRCARGLQKQTGNYEFQLDTVEEPALLLGEEWREIDIKLLVQEKEARKNRKKVRIPLDIKSPPSVFHQ